MFIKYRTPAGRTVEVVQFEEEAGLPVFCAEVIDSVGDVIEFIPRIVGHAGLTALAARRRWAEVSR